MEGWEHCSEGGDAQKQPPGKKLRRDRMGGPSQTFLVSLWDFKLTRIAEVKTPGFQEGEGARAIDSSGRVGERAPPQSASAPLPSPPALSLSCNRRRAAPALCREIWELASAESTYAPGASPAVRTGTVSPLPGLRAAGARTRTTRPSTSRSHLTVLPVSPPGALLPGQLSVALFCCLPPARSAMVWQCV